MLVRLLYVSVVSDGVTSTDIDRFVAQSRRRNRQLDLTGALLVCDGKFAQAIEGREVLVEELVRRIAADPRHHDMVVHERSLITRRLFLNWDMAFIDDTRCDEDFRNMFSGRLKADDFIATMAA